MITVQVFWKDSGKPARNMRVSIGFDGWFRGVTGNEITDSNGEVHFDSEPGQGEVYVDGKTAYKGMIKGRVIVYI